MKTHCLKCNGSGSIIVDYKTCDACNGTGYENDMYDLRSHFKGIADKARDKFDLGSDTDIPCEACHGKGQIPVYEECSFCKGTGSVFVCSKCGKHIDGTYDLCKDCYKKQKQEEFQKVLKDKMRQKEADKPKIVYVIDPIVEMKDIKQGNLYKGKVTRVENYGVFVTLNNNVWGLMRCDSSQYKKGQEVIVRVTDVKDRERKIDLTPAHVNNYKLKKLTKTMKRTRIIDLENNMGKIAKIEGRILQIQQTSGPTIFIITDETGITEIAAFDEAGVRAYPEIEMEEGIQVIGEVNQRSGKIQIEAQSISKLSKEDENILNQLIDDALNKKARPKNVPFLIKSSTLNKLKPKIYEAAQKIRKAVYEGRPILVRHHNDADGICAGVAMEKALIPLIKEIHSSNDAEYYYFKRSPSKAPFYELEDVVKDLSFALEDLERHGQKLPLIVLLDNGSTEEDIVSLMQAKIYDIEIVVIDHHSPGELFNIQEEDGEIVGATVTVDEYVDIHVNPYLVGGDSQITAGALATEVAHIINPEIEELVKHLPGVAAIGDHAEGVEVIQYLELAEQKGYTKDDLKKIAECIDFEAYFLRFMNGRGIIDTILAVDNIDKHEKMIVALYKEYEKRVQTQLRAVLPNIKRTQLENGIYFNLIDVEKFAHKFTFPAPGKTCGFVHSHIVKELGEDKPIVTLGHGPDFGVFRATDSVNEKYGFNVNEIVTSLSNLVPAAGIDGGGHECAGSIKYIEGLGEKVLSKIVGEIQKM